MTEDNLDYYYEYNGKKIPVFEIDLTNSDRYHTFYYKEAMKIVEENNVELRDIDKTISWYFNNCPNIPKKDRLSVEEISYCEGSRIIIVRTYLGKTTFEQRNYIAKETGWYFYVTGPDVPPSEISSVIDEIQKKFDQNCLNWEDSEYKQSLENKVKTQIKLTAISNRQNENSYLLQIGNKKILLDAGISPYSEKFGDPSFLLNKVRLDAIYISHSHRDHEQGLQKIVKRFPDIPIILSRTTLDFMILNSVYRRFHDYGADQSNSDHLKLNKIENLIVQNSILVENSSKLYFKPDHQEDNYLQFFFAGHYPGALMFYLSQNSKSFLYTGDYTHYNYLPIPGVESIIKDIPKPIDTLLVDGSFSDEEFATKDEQFDFLAKTAVEQVIKGKNLLIGADSYSVALLIFRHLHTYFLELQDPEIYAKRPIFYLDNRILDAAKIICERTEDIHPESAKDINNQMNPFCSAMIRWIKDYKDIYETLEHLMKEPTTSNFIIYEPPDLRTKRMIEFFKGIAYDPENAVYLSGRLTTKSVIELISQNDDIRLEYMSKNKLKSEPFHNKAFIQNRIDPSKIINLHGDKIQLMLLLNQLKPKKVIFFHRDPKWLVKTRIEVTNLDFVKDCYALYKDDTRVFEC